MYDVVRLNEVDVSWRMLRETEKGIEHAFIDWKELIRLKLTLADRIQNLFLYFTYVVSYFVVNYGIIPSKCYLVRSIYLKT